MKKILSVWLCSRIIILILILISCNKNTPIPYNVISKGDYDDQNLFSRFFKIISIADKSGLNRLTLRISCQDTETLNKIAESKWRLITMVNQDTGLNTIISNDSEPFPRIPVIKAKMQIEIVKREIQAGVVGYYIKKMYSTDDFNKKNDNWLIESEFISENETIGGYLEICQTQFSKSNSIWMKAETLDDPSVEPITGITELTARNRYINIGFLDHNSITHAWRVLVRHDITTFPIIYWIGGNNLP